MLPIQTEKNKLSPKKLLTRVSALGTDCVKSPTNRIFRTYLLFFTQPGSEADGRFREIILNKSFLFYVVEPEMVVLTSGSGRNWLTF